MASRGYKRDSKGRFAGGGAAVKTTYGKAGGFANASFRARTANNAATKRHRKAMVKRGVRVGGIVGAGALTALGARQSGSSLGRAVVAGAGSAYTVKRAYDILGV